MGPPGYAPDGLAQGERRQRDQRRNAAAGDNAGALHGQRVGFPAGDARDLRLDTVRNVEKLTDAKPTRLLGCPDLIFVTVGST